MAKNLEEREQEKRLAVVRAQQDWEAVLNQFTQEKKRLEEAITRTHEKSKSDLQSDKQASQLDVLQIKLINLEYLIRRHFEFAYGSEILVDAAKENSQRNLPTREDSIAGMVYNNWGAPPRIDVSTPSGFYRHHYLDSWNISRADWMLFVDSVNQFYNHNKGDLRALCEAVGDGLAGSMLGGVLGRAGGSLPHGLNRDLSGQLGGEAAKSMGVGRFVCDSGMGPRAQDVLRELALR